MVPDAFIDVPISLTDTGQISPQCPDGKQKLFGLLAFKQLEKAAVLSELAEKVLN